MKANLVAIDAFLSYEATRSPRLVERSRLPQDLPVILSEFRLSPSSTHCAAKQWPCETLVEGDVTPRTSTPETSSPRSCSSWTSTPRACRLLKHEKVAKKQASAGELSMKLTRQLSLPEDGLIKAFNDPQEQRHTTYSLSLGGELAEKFRRQREKESQHVVNIVVATPR